MNWLPSTRTGRAALPVFTGLVLVVGMRPRWRLLNCCNSLFQYKTAYHISGKQFFYVRYAEPPVGYRKNVDKRSAAVGQASQKRSRLLFHGLICLWFRNSGFALKQPRHDVKFHLMKFRKRSLCFAYALPATALLYVIVLYILLMTYRRQYFFFK